MRPTADATRRRLPVYLLLDCSGSMAGEPITALREGVRGLVEDLVNDPYELQNVAGKKDYAQIQAELAAKLQVNALCNREDSVRS